MVAVSGALIFAGYTFVAYGLSQLRGQNVGFLDLLWPGRLTASGYKAPPADSGSSASSGGVTNPNTGKVNPPGSPQGGQTGRSVGGGLKVAPYPQKGL